jgi:hypothetical protein
MPDEIQPDRPNRRRSEDEEEDYEPRRKRRRDEDDDDDPDRFRLQDTDATGGLIPYKNPQALISYYCGVFALIPCVGNILGPVALVLGWLGIRYRNKHPTAGGLAHAVVGIVLGVFTTLAYWGIILVGVGMLAFNKYP